MSKTVYAVLFHVDETKLPVILGAIAGSATLVSVTATEKVAVEEPKPKRDQHFVGGKRNKGISGEELVLKLLGESKSGMVSNDEFKAAFIAHGFAAHSFSPPLSILVAKGKVRNMTHGRWCLAGTTITKGASSS